MIGGFFSKEIVRGGWGGLPRVVSTKPNLPDEIRHFRMEDRKIIARMKKDKKPQTEIARTIGFSQSAISKELARDSGKRNYLPKQVQAHPLGGWRS